MGNPSTHYTAVLTLFLSASAITLLTFAITTKAQGCSISIRNVSKFQNLTAHFEASGMDLGASTLLSGESFTAMAPAAGTLQSDMFLGNLKGTFTLYNGKAEAQKCSASGGLQWQVDEGGLSEKTGSKFVLRYRWPKSVL